MVVHLEAMELLFCVVLLTVESVYKMVEVHLEEHLEVSEVSELLLLLH